MKKLLIASTALVATAGMAAADVTVTGHAAAGYHSNLVQKSGLAAAKQRTEGIYSNVGVDFSMSGATDNGISFTAALNIDAGTEIDQGDYEFDGADGGTAGLGAVTMSGDFGTLTFDDNGIGNLFDGDYSNHDISYATTVNGVAITVAADADESVGTAATKDDASAKAVVTAGDMTYTLTASNNASAGMSTKVAVAYTVNDMLSVNANSKSLSAAGSKTVAGVGATIVTNGLTVTVASDNAQPASGWDLDLAYSLGDVALTYGTDENSSHDLTATYALGGGATFKAGMRNHGTATAKAGYKDSLYAGVSFAF